MTKSQFWFWRKTHFNVIQAFLLPCYYLLLRKADPDLNKSEFSAPIGKTFRNFQCILTLSLWKLVHVGPFIWAKPTSVYPMILCSKLVLNRQNCFGKENFKRWHSLWRRAWSIIWRPWTYFYTRMFWTCISFCLKLVLLEQKIFKL